jgi:hypothetical protein
MKKTLFIGFVAVVFSAMLVSCDEKRTCECTVSVTFMGYTSSETVAGEYDGDCSDAENMPEVQQVKDALGSYGSMDISCREK